MPALKIDSGKPERLAALALVIIGLVVHLDCLGSEFVFDDVQYINAHTFHPLTFEWLATDLESPIKGRPLVGLSLFINFLICGIKPAGYHLFNLAVHLACTLMLFGVVRQGLIRWRLPRRPRGNTTGIAFSCALLWMTHPLPTECINYVSQRTESMASLFILLSLYCAIRSYDVIGRTRWIVFTGIAAWAGAFCKETAALAPLLIVLFDMSFAKQDFMSTLRERWRLHAAAFTNWIPIAALMIAAPRSATVGTTGSVTILQYAMNQSVLLIQYLRLAVWPDALVIDYGHPRELPLLQVLPAAIAVLAMLALTLAVYRRRPAIGFLGIAAFLLLAPTSSFIPINSEVGAERRMYLPLGALVVLLVMGAERTIRRGVLYIRQKRLLKVDQFVSNSKFQSAAGCLILAVIAIPLGLRTSDRNRDYSNPLKLWTDSVIAYPDNSRAWSWLATEFLRVDPATAEHVTGKMAERWRDDVSISLLAGDHYLGFHDNRAKAARCFRRVLELEPQHTKAQLRLIWLLSASIEDEVRDGAEALKFAVALNERYPHEPELLDALAMANAECGNFDVATEIAELAIASSQSNSQQAAIIEYRLAGYRRHEPFRLGQRD